jgi:lysophospholipase L1-like esterase
LTSEARASETVVLRWIGGMLLAFFGVAVSCGLLELGLRICGFHFDPSPIVEFGWPQPKKIESRYRTDPDLFWVPKNYDEMLRDARASHPAIVFLGDSCTQYGNYPQLTVDILKQHASPVASGMAFGVGGWSSEQGRAQLERDILSLRPRVITMYFGWNDHWVALGPPDKDVRSVMAVTRLSASSRLIQLYLKFRFAERGTMSERPNRVSLERYAANIAAMVRGSRATGVRTVLITAPTNMRPETVPGYLAERWARHLEEIPALHDEYVEATREAAEATGATLCDVARAFEARPEAPSTYFRKDQIHLTPAGDRAVAELLAACIERAVASAPPSG